MWVTVKIIRLKETRVKGVYNCTISFISNSEKCRKQISSCLGLEVDRQD